MTILINRIKDFYNDNKNFIDTFFIFFFINLIFSGILSLCITVCFISICLTIRFVIYLDVEKICAFSAMFCCFLFWIFAILPSFIDNNKEYIKSLNSLYK